jgi:hypothetical protein
MKFYDARHKRAIIYEDEDGTMYHIGIYKEEYPDGGAETVSGCPRKLEENEKQDYLTGYNKEDQFGE